MGSKWLYSCCLLCTASWICSKQHTVFLYSFYLAFSLGILLKSKLCNHTVVLTSLQLGKIPVLFYLRDQTGVLKCLNKLVWFDVRYCEDLNFLKWINFGSTWLELFSIFCNNNIKDFSPEEIQPKRKLIKNSIQCRPLKILLNIKNVFNRLVIRNIFKKIKPFSKFEDNFIKWWWWVVFVVVFWEIFGIILLP